MKRFFTLFVGLSANEFQSGLVEIEQHFATVRKDDYMNALVNEVQVANQSLLDRMHTIEVKHNANREARLLTSRIVSVQRYADSCRYVDDEAVRNSADRVLAVFKTYDKAFARMTTYARAGAVRTLQRELAAEDLQEHLGRMPEMDERIASVQSALSSLEAKLLEVDAVSKTPMSGESLLSLKRVAAAKLRSLVEYLLAMSAKEPENYGEHYRFVTNVIDKLNARHQKGRAATPTAGPITLAVEPESDAPMRVG